MQNRSFAAAVKAAFPHTIPIMTGYLAVGMAYGVLMASKGYNFLWARYLTCLLDRGHISPPIGWAFLLLWYHKSL